VLTNCVQYLLRVVVIYHFPVFKKLVFVLFLVLVTKESVFIAHCALIFVSCHSFVTHIASHVRKIIILLAIPIAIPMLISLHISGLILIPHIYSYRSWSWLIDNRIESCTWIGYIFSIALSACRNWHSSFLGHYT
jgi:hypothetical protein